MTDQNMKQRYNDSYDERLCVGMAKAYVCMNNEAYVGIDVHERESQIAMLNKDGELLEEKRVPTCSLTKYVSSINGRKHVAMEAVGFFVYPIYDKLNDCTVSVASPYRLIAKSKLKNDRVDAIALGELLIKDQLLASYDR